jgi:transcriptional regulator with XRE-family HTH domain
MGRHLRELRVDAGVSQSALARASGVDDGHISRIEAGTAMPSLDALLSIGLALGSDLSVRFYPGSGPRLRDRFQAPMVEALLRLLDGRWIARPEIPVTRPVRGVIDVVLTLDDGSTVVACEAQSELRRLEETLRRATEKARALSSADPDAPSASRLLLLRSTERNRELARRYEATLRAAYPAAARSAHEALRDASRPWPGPAIVWARFERGRATILDAPPRGVALGR